MKITLAETIKKMIDIVPNKKEDKLLVKKLMLILNESFKKDPETMLSWDLVDQALQEYIIKPEKDWHFNILDFFKGNYEKYSIQLNLLMTNYNEYIKLIRN